MHGWMDVCMCSITYPIDPIAQMRNLPHCHGLAAAMRLQQLNDALQNKALSRARGA